MIVRRIVCLIVGCVLSTYIDNVKSISYVAPCVKWIEENHPNRFQLHNDKYLFPEYNGMPAKLVHPCLLALFMDNTGKTTLAKDTPDEDPWTKERPPATIPPASYGIFGNLSGYEEPAYHLGLLPMDVGKLNTAFLLVDGAMNHIEHIVQPWDVLRNVRSITYEKVYVLAHDFNQDPDAEPDMMYNLTSLLLRYNVPSQVLQPDILVILVEWSDGARAGLNNTFYRQAAVNTVLVGRQVGKLLEHLQDTLLVHSDNIHLIGEGLGAQVLHFAARAFTRSRSQLGHGPVRVGRLTALDPMAAQFEGFRPLFGEWPHVSKLDATRVDVITTSAGQYVGVGLDPLNGQLGMSQSVGFKHFYVNGGREQPYCLDEWPGTQHIYYDFCFHEKALIYFMYSLTPHANRTLLIAKRSGSYVNLLTGTQRETRNDIFAQAYLGMEAFAGDDNLDGEYYISIDVDDNLVAHGLPLDLIPETEARKTPIRILRVPSQYHMPDSHETYLNHGVQKARLSRYDAKSCGKFRQDPKLEGNGSRIFHGQRPYLSQFPWAVCIMTFNRKKWIRTCSGAILDHRWILTAAHCVEFPDYIPIYVTYGTNECEILDTGYFKRVIIEVNTTVFTHPRYTAGDDANDVALIRLLEPIDEMPSYGEDYTGGLVNSVCFHTNQNYKPSVDQKIYVPGFGSKGTGSSDNFELTWTYGYRADELMEKDFQPIFRTHMLRVQRTEVLEFYRNDNWHTTCGGDSGSSYLWYVDTGDEDVEEVSRYRAVTVSIVNSGVDSCDYRYFNDFTGLGIGMDIAVKAYHPEIYDWIVGVMDLDENLLENFVPEAVQASEWPRPIFDLIFDDSD
ncbi:Pancreatic triacylglycerol lipase [Halotydeus destructor]|nr:Pancreatic triacylglycerol lipase [Halotydeus destructor]